MLSWGGALLLGLAACGKTAEKPADVAPPEADVVAEAPKADVAAEAPKADAAGEAPKADAAAEAPKADAAAETVSAAPRYFRAKVQLPGDLVLPMLVTIEGSGGQLDIPMQQISKLPLSEVKLTQDALAFGFVPPGAPEGALVRMSAKKAADGDVWSGELDQHGMKLPLTVEPLASAADFPPKRPQTPMAPFAYPTEAVKIEVEGGSLGCTLVVPNVKGPRSAVILLTGSGAQDRDETIFDHKPFLVIADFFARSGVASLRCDDRGVGESSSAMASADLPLFVRDAKAMLELLRARAITKDRVGALGHSEGGMVVAELAKAGEIAFAVTLAGPAKSGREVSVYQNVESLRAQGVPADKAAAIEKSVDAFFMGMAEDLPEAELEARAKTMAEAVAAAREASPGPAPTVEQLVQQFMQMTKSAWLKSWVKAKPAELLAASKVPVLALFGEKDTQVPGADHAVALKAAFEAAKKDNGEIEVIAGVNHLFQQAKTGKISEYGEIEETFSPAVLQRLAGWVAAQGGK